MENIGSDVLYRGFIETNEKKAPVKQYVGKELLSFDEANKCNGFAGVLANDIILVDVDDEIQAYILYNIVLSENIKCKITKTKRGMHFVMRASDKFTKGGVDFKIACGVRNVDIKLGNKNGLQLLKHEGNLRPVLRDSDEYDVIPDWMLPISTKIEFTNDCDRNDTLNRYIYKMCIDGFTQKTIKTCVELINTYIFQEHHKEKRLPEYEIKTLLRDARFEAMQDNKMDLLTFAENVVDMSNIILLDEKLYIYKDGIYINDDTEIETKINYINRKISEATLNSIFKRLKRVLIERNVQFTRNLEHIAFKNGIYSIKEDKLLPFSSDVIITNKIPVNFNPNAKCNLVDKTLLELASNDNEIVQLLEEFIGYCFYPTILGRSSILILGDKGCGKSTFVEAILRDVISEKNCSLIHIKDFKERFYLSEICDKLVNIGDDIDPTYVADTSVLKRAISGNEIMVEKKGKERTPYKPYAKHIFTANATPRILDDGQGVSSRFIIVPFKNKFPDSNPDLITKLHTTEAQEYIVQLGLKGLKRFLANSGQFSIPEASEMAKKEFMSKNNPILLFLDETDVDGEITDTAYELYCNFCMTNGYKSKCKQAFCQEVCKNGYESKQIRINTLKKEFNEKLKTASNQLFVKAELKKLDKDTRVNVSVFRKQ